MRECLCSITPDFQERKADLENKGYTLYWKGETAYIYERKEVYYGD